MNVKHIGYGFKASVEPTERMLVDGYLLEEVLNDETGKLETHNLIAISVIGRVQDLDQAQQKYFHLFNSYVQSPKHNGALTLKEEALQIDHLPDRDDVHLHSLETENMVRTGERITIVGSEELISMWLSPYKDANIESDCRLKGGKRQATFIQWLPEENMVKFKDALKTSGVEITFSEPVSEALLFKRRTIFHPTYRQENLNGDSKSAYLIGATPEEAKSQFWNVLDRLSAPIQMVWEEHFWDEFLRRGWITQLPGHRIFGYKVRLDQTKILELLSDMLKFGLLPSIIPEEEPPAAEAA